jgi:hypothetical protein
MATLDMTVDFTGHDVNLFIIKPSGTVMTVSDSDLIIELPSDLIIFKVLERGEA